MYMWIGVTRRGVFLNGIKGLNPGPLAPHERKDLGLLYICSDSFGGGFVEIFECVVEKFITNLGIDS